MAEDFADLGLDGRLLKALRKMGFGAPTPVQVQCIPLAIEGKDVLVRAPTGSGKTVAYAAPVLHRLLTELGEGSGESGGSASWVRAVFLVPTRELCAQVQAAVGALLAYAGGVVTVAKVAGDEPIESQRARLAPASLPHVLIATPARVLQHLHAGNLRLRSSTGYDGGPGALEFLVVDEADLLLSYGYGSDLEKIGPLLPSCVQTILVSATLTPDLDAVTSLLLQNPVTVDIGGASGASALEGAARAADAADGHGGRSEWPHLSQYWVECTSKDKLLLIFALLKLNRIPGRCLVFANEVSRSFRIKLFLEQFGVHCGILNSELPVNSRWHIIQAFNRGAFDFLVATDDPVVGPGAGTGGDAGADNGAGAGADGDGHGAGERRSLRKGKRPARRRATPQWDAEFGVSRGVDFQGVTAVINFDLPANLAVYQHRIGRTARGGLDGTSISFVATDDPAQAAYLLDLQAQYGDALRPLRVEYSKLAAFRYRVEDAARAITRAAVQEARLREVRSELLNSERLRAHFEENPHDLHVLQHDKPLATVRPAPELKHIPRYLLPDKRDAVERQATAHMAGIASAVRKKLPKHKLVPKHRRKHDPLKALSAKSDRARGRKRSSGTMGSASKLKRNN